MKRGGVQEEEPRPASLLLLLLPRPPRHPPWRGPSGPATAGSSPAAESAWRENTPFTGAATLWLQNGAAGCHTHRCRLHLTFPQTAQQLPSGNSSCSRRCEEEEEKEEEVVEEEP